MLGLPEVQIRRLQTLLKITLPAEETIMKVALPVESLLLQPVLAVFPHGLQHGSRRNAHRAMGVVAAGRRERQAVDEAVAELLRAARG
jgi:hypothetical protein